MKDTRIAPYLFIALATLATGPGCKTIGKVNALLDEATETARKAGDVADNVPMLVENATMAATDAVSQSAAALGGIPAMASRFTGGTDLGRTSDGRKGSLTEDADGDGSTEDILVFVDDREETFLAFELTYEGEQGRDCYTSWDEPDGVWLIITECGDHPEGELVDVCTWSHDDDDLACLGLTCSGDECDLDLCYDEQGEVECELEDDDGDDDDDDDDDVGDDDDDHDDNDVGDDDDDDDDDDAACDEAATLVEDAYFECGYSDPGLDCTQDPGAIAGCADALEAADDVCAFLDTADGFELCPWG